MGTLLLVHGTGVRLLDFLPVVETVRKISSAVGIRENIRECAWGDPLGVKFDRLLSVPEPPSRRQAQIEEEDRRTWEWLFNGPLLELETLTIADPKNQVKPLPPGKQAAWQKLWNEKILPYKGSQAFDGLLDREGLRGFWCDAWEAVAKSETAAAAFKSSAHELPHACAALARALVAQLHVIALSNGYPGPSRVLRQDLIRHLLNDWGERVLAPSNFFVNFLKGATTRALRRGRNDWTATTALPIGDILLYQSRGAEVQGYIRRAIEAAEPPVTIVAHSLGGLACFDLLARRDPPEVARLVTVGSQVSFFYEIGALSSLKPPQPLPEHFPKWCNIYDRHDFLSYVANPLFAQVEDVEVKMGQPFPDSHSAYFVDEKVWLHVRDFINSAAATASQ
jgi:pimeloyl-ACP methyl ester carboxylesterase